MLHPLEFAALLSAARTSSPNDHALVCLLGMLGPRVSDACSVDITDIRYESGYELLHVIGKGAKPADTPLAVLKGVSGRLTRTNTSPTDAGRLRHQLRDRAPSRC